MKAIDCENLDGGVVSRRCVVLKDKDSCMWSVHRPYLASFARTSIRVFLLRIFVHETPYPESNLRYAGETEPAEHMTSLL